MTSNVEFSQPLVRMPVEACNGADASGGTDSLWLHADGPTRRLVGTNGPVSSSPMDIDAPVPDGTAGHQKAADAVWTRR